MSPLSIYIKSDDWHANRRLGLGGSDATILAEGDADRIHDLWLLKTGRKDPGIELNLPILLGVVTEDVNRHWFEHTTGRKVWADGEERIHPDYPWIRASLDGITTAEDGREAYWEAKAVNAFWKLPNLVRKYNAQVHHCMACGGWEVSVLSVILGNKHVVAEIEFDAWLWLDILDIEKEFWACITEDREPTPNSIRGIK